MHWKQKLLSLAAVAGLTAQILALPLPVVAADALDFEISASGLTASGAEVSRITEDTYQDSLGSVRVTVTDRGGMVYISQNLQAGESYEISAALRLSDGASTAQFVISKEGKAFPDYVAVGTKVTSEGWTVLQGIYECAEDTNASIGIRVGDGTQLISYYLDDFSVKGGAISSDETTLETNQTASVQFSDVTRDHWAKDYIELMTERGILSGRDTGSYDPEGTLTRAEWVTILVRSGKWKVSDYTGGISDVHPEDWYANQVGCAVSEGLVDEAMLTQGCFLPDNPITREETAVMAVRAYEHLKGEEAPTGDLSEFADAEAVSDWASDSVAKAVGLGILRGSDGAVLPEGLLTRAEAAAMIQRTLEKVSQSVYYVDPINGSDENSGTEDAPLQSIEKARDTVRGELADMKQNIYVYLQDGDYFIPESIKWNEDDSGQNGYYVIYRGVSGAEPIINGGQKVTGWELHDAEKNIYKAPANGIDTRQLYINGARGVRARSEGGLTDAVADSGEKGIICSDTFLADFAHVDELEMVFKSVWTNPRVRVSSIAVNDDGMAELTMQQPAWYDATNKGQTSVDVPWYYENAYELLDEEGEWYLDKTTDTFYYKPKAGENMQEAVVIAPVLEELVNIAGTSLDTPVHHIRFDNICFRYSTWLRPNGIYCHVDAQNNHLRDSSGGTDILPPAAVMVLRGNHIDFTNCDFSRLGIGGLQLIKGVQDCLIEGNEFYDISGSGMNIGEPYMRPEVYNPTDQRLLMSGFTVRNNYVHDVAVEYRSAAGISTGYICNSQLVHNELANLPYTGFHIGIRSKCLFLEFQNL